jgi:transcription elongation GreA/GreB family factor
VDGLAAPRPVRRHDNAEIVEARAPDEVDVGRSVTIEDTKSGKRRTLVIGSYQVLDQQQESEISYVVTLASPLLSATVREEREVTLGNRQLSYPVVAIA